MRMFKVAIDAREMRDVIEFGKTLRDKLIQCVMESITGIEGVNVRELDEDTAYDMARADPKTRLRVIGTGYGMYTFENGMPNEMRMIRTVAEALYEAACEAADRHAEENPDPDPLAGKSEESLDIASKIADQMCTNAKQ